MTTETISGISPLEVQRGELSRMFLGRARAVILCDDERIRRLLDSVFHWLGIDAANSTDTKSAFGKNLVNLARNHIEGNMLAGDMLRIEPGRIVYTARKFIVYRSAIDQSLRSYPETFHSGYESNPVPFTILELASDLMLEIFASALPRSLDSQSSYATQIEILIYPESSSDIEGLRVMLADSCGRWSRWGSLIDAYRNNAHGIFDMKSIRDLYALGSMVPVIGGALRSLDRRMASVIMESVPKNYFLLGRAHVDDGKYLTALAGSRDNLQTQVLVGKAWIPLQVVPDTLAIFPSPKITSRTGIPATCHRVLLRELNGNETNGRNISVALSIVDRPNWLP